MDPITQGLALLTEALKTFNSLQAGKPPEQIKAEGIIAWGVAKSLIKVILDIAPEEQAKPIRDALLAAGIKL